MRRQLAIVATATAGVAFGVLSPAIARREPFYSFAGELPVSCAHEPELRAAELLAGWALLAAGLVASTRREATYGALLVAASFAWFLLEWNNPGVGSAIGFALGLALCAVAPPLVAHAALVYPGRRLSRLEWLALARQDESKPPLAAGVWGQTLVLANKIRVSPTSGRGRARSPCIGRGRSVETLD